MTDLPEGHSATLQSDLSDDSDFWVCSCGLVYHYNPVQIAVDVAFEYFKDLHKMDRL